MSRRTWPSAYQAAARAWLTLAGLSLLLPPARRLGLWLPLHLTLAGAASVAIAGAMQGFAAALTSTAAASGRWTWTQFTSMNLGVLLIALGRAQGRPGWVALGGAGFVIGAAMLLWFVRRAWRRAINKRHRLPIAMYTFATLCVIAGGAFGALMGSGAIRDGADYSAVLGAHIMLNVLGWVSVTIVGTLITLLPTVFRVRMPGWHGTGSAVSLAAGVLLLAAGSAARSTPTAAVGGICEFAGALGVAWMVVRVARTPRRHPIPIAGLHMVCGVAWFTIGSAALMVSTLRGRAGVDAFLTDFLVIFAIGWIVQVLLGAWSYLLPVGRPGDPSARRARLIAFEWAALLQVLIFNAGVFLMAARAAGWLGSAGGSLGAWLALVGGGLALAKAWWFSPLADLAVSGRRGRSVWGAAG